MRNRSLALAVALLALATATAVPAPPAPGATGAAGRVRSQGNGLGFRPAARTSPIAATRFRGGRVPSRPLRRSRPFRDVGRGVLQALGLAYLLNLLFGWGEGGSPLGLLLLAALIGLLVFRRRAAHR